MLYRNLAETFKTPGKLRGKPPHTARKQNASEARVVSLRIRRTSTQS